ncbi:hypothetical protein CC78DRAFT_529485 [Lojkania enalia]|uniref:Cwf18 pre-mRNA splicing factor n=1 Tax=Lojkania enalia TaxID=147567 RepID=A0A9P4N9U0_9PLEO|nr:hypothetical protein CC78DRAFT_529485 [Didymosphaeria enalia]
MSSHETLSAAANDRKARLAQLKSLKRKQAPTNEETPTTSETASTSRKDSTALTAAISPITDVTATYISGRNYDPESRNVKLGFEGAPVDPSSTLEYKAAQLALASKAQQEAEQQDDKGLDFTKLQPKKPNWDLKRDLQEKMRGLDVQTENAIAKLVRERVEEQKKASGTKASTKGEGEEVGMEGSELVEAMHLREREGEADRRREEEDAGVS